MKIEKGTFNKVRSFTQCAEWTLDKIEKLSTGPLQDERACTWCSDDILF